MDTTGQRHEDWNGVQLHRCEHFYLKQKIKSFDQTQTSTLKTGV